VLVLGLGDTGISVARFARRRGAAAIRVLDTRPEPPARAALEREIPEAELRTGPYLRDSFTDVDLIVVSPGVPKSHELILAAQAHGVPLVGDIELFAWTLLALERRPAILAVTGTNGKSTVTALTGALVRSMGYDTEVAGNIGPAVLDALLRRERDGTQPQVWVLELSSYQLETTYSLDPHAAAMLNLSADHLDRYRGIEDYAAAKKRIFEGHGVQVLNRDDPASMAMRRPGRCVITFGLDAPPAAHDFGLLDDAGSAVLARGGTALCAVSELKLAGRHNVANALAALALASIVDASPSHGAVNAVSLRNMPAAKDAAQAAALREFAGLPHRVERVAEIDGVSYYDDSKGTNVGSTLAALRGLGETLLERGNRVLLIAGGDGKGQDFTPLAEPVGRLARAVVLLGRDAARIEGVLQGTGVPLIRARDMSEAVRIAHELVRPGDIVLLSPACASFDMFRDYAHRAQAFVAAVRGLAGE
jgi:UDP-N-acetylmuramoylalanine--D-glutamate ligase